jgi:hypothetical protein
MYKYKPEVVVPFREVKKSTSKRGGEGICTVDLEHLIVEGDQ